MENTTNPPSVQIPAVENYSTTVLSISTCPVPLLPLFRRWQQAVEPLQALSLDNQHDVARLICDLEPVNTPVRTSMIRVAADLQQIAIQLAQRETYLQRYASDLQVGLGSPNLDERAQPPPTYSRPDAPPSSSNPTNTSGRPLPIPPASPASIPITEDPGMMAVRETLYAALADVLYSTPSIGSVLRTDPPRGYFTAVALAIQQVALTNLTPDGNRIRIVGSGHRRNASFGVDDAPEPLRVFAQEIIKLGAILKELQAKDDEHAIHLAVEGLEPGTSPTNMELLQSELEHGADSNHEQDGVQVAEIRSIANHIGRIALGTLTQRLAVVCS